jgi:predicted DNA-binding ribbon-helix-helix protein
MKSSLVAKRTIVLAGRKTSISIEDDFWKGFRAIAKARGLTVSELVAIVDADRQQNNLSSAIRLFVLGFYRDRISDQSADEEDPSVGLALGGRRRAMRPPRI